jgi:hypothetical protein
VVHRRDPLAASSPDRWTGPGSSPLIYQHANRDREREIARALSGRIEAIRNGDLAREWHDADSDETAEGA